MLILSFIAKCMPRLALLNKPAVRNIFSLISILSVMLITSDERLLAQGRLHNTESVAVDAYDGKAVLGDHTGKVSLFDVSTPNNPVLLSTLYIPDRVISVALAGPRILAAGQGGIYILSTAIPGAITIENVLARERDVRAVVAAGDLGYAATGSSLLLFDIPTGTILDERNYAGLPLEALALSGDYLYLLSCDENGTNERGVTKILVEDYLDAPVASLGVPAGSEAWVAGRMFIYADSQLIYLGSSPANDFDPAPPLAIIRDGGSSLNLLSNPVSITAADARPFGNGLLVISDVELSALRQGGLGILDISDPASPGKVIRKALTPTAPLALSLYFGHAYTPNSEHNIAITDLVTPNGSRSVPSVELETNFPSGPALENSLLRLTALTRGSDIIRSVDFYVDDQKVATDGNYPFEYRLITKDSSLQSSATLQACAEDLNNNRSCSPKQTVEFAKNTSGLWVVSVVPLNKAHLATGNVPQIRARFSRPVDPSTLSTTHVRLERLDPRSGAVVETISLSHVAYQSIGNAATIVPGRTLSSGTYRVTLGSGIKSAVGGSLPSDYSWAFAVGAEATWINPVSGNWSVASNWAGGVVPQSGDNVSIAIPGVTVTYNQGTLAINNLSVGAGSQLSIAGGSLSVDGQGQLSIFSLSGGTLGGTGSVNISSQWNWTGGTLSGVLNLAKTATTQIGPAVVTTLSGGTINNQGTVDLKTGTELFVGGAINNLSGATWNVQGDVSVAEQSGGAFNNTGTFLKSAGTGTTGWSVPLTGTGSISVTSGTINLSGATTGTISGTINVGTGAALNYGQNGSTLNGGQVTGTGTFSFTFSAAVTVNGTYNFSGQTQIESATVKFTGAAAIGNLNFSGGTLGGTGSINISGTMKWNGGTITFAGTLATNDLTLSASGSVSLTLGATVISVSAKITLAGTLGLQFSSSYAPPVGTQIPVLKFSAGFAGTFASIGNLLLSNGDPLSLNLSASGLSLTVDMKPQN